MIDGKVTEDMETNNEVLEYIKIFDSGRYSTIDFACVHKKDQTHHSLGFAYDSKEKSLKLFGKEGALLTFDEIHAIQYGKLG